MTAADTPDFAESRQVPVFDSGAPSIWRRAQRVWEYRELLSSLTRKEIKVQYKDSALGFLWTLLNPLLYLAVFSVVFTAFLKAGVPFYGLFLLSGLLAWTLFANGLGGATSSVVGNGSLVQKVWFPREILPLAAIGSAIFTFFFQFVVLVIALIVFTRSPEWKFLPLLVPAMAVTVLWAVGMGLLLSSLNVLYRDVQHFLELLLLAWFWMTPVVYQYDFVGDTLVDWFGTDRVAMLNPMVPVVTTFQRVIYNPTHAMGTPAQDQFDMMYRSGFWYLENLALSGLLAVVVLFIGLKVFGRLEADFGEEL